ncbi:MAG: hypothetical protein A2289_21330 [Deltaproteobacteria bacterium RIFOXYA12_FULL_58_15]|nr:MAG: hypothetical protein A2289_21330 [Deltaproteobacteria bacterium RIFOXYA12_FULL_58_15]OGR09736.1 MAG: hypothetical protein A2341_13045 [Deltaproteobacteria bacterium RIFOXYB12_FULL_58_9]
MTTLEQQRQYLRRPIHASFRVRDAGDPSQGEILFDSVDLSQGGAFLESELLLEIGEMVEVTFGLPGKIRPIRATARVAWATGKGTCGMGLEFVNLNDEDRQAIAEYVHAASTT